LRSRSGTSRCSARWRTIWRLGCARPVRISHRPDELRIIIDDDGPLQPVAKGDGDGHGLAGMRERAAVVGGTLTAGPKPDGGFRVAATFPLASSTHEVLFG
jgi:signal transduction histidine kinase